MYIKFVTYINPVAKPCNILPQYKAAIFLASNKIRNDIDDNTPPIIRQHLRPFTFANHPTTYGPEIVQIKQFISNFMFTSVSM